MPDFALSVEASPMATNDPTPLFLSDYAEEPEQPDIEAWDRAVISSRILKASILVVTVAAIGFAILWLGNPLMLFANATASLVATSAPQDGTDQSTTTIQSTAGTQGLPPTARDTPTRDEIAAAFRTAGQTQTEIPQAPTEPLLNQFQAWAAEEDARAQERPVQPAQDAQAQPAQDAQAQPAQDAQAQPVEDARTQIRPAQKHRQVRHVQNARAEIRAEQNLRAKVRRKQNARVQVRPVQDARAQDQPVQNAQAPSFLQSLGLRN
jgi:hypothetical protein